MRRPCTKTTGFIRGTGLPSAALREISCDRASGDRSGVGRAALLVPVESCSVIEYSFLVIARSTWRTLLISILKINVIDTPVSVKRLFDSFAARRFTGFPPTPWQFGSAERCSPPQPAGRRGGIETRKTRMADDRTGSSRASLHRTGQDAIPPIAIFKRLVILHTLQLAREGSGGAMGRRRGLGAH